MISSVWQKKTTNVIRIFLMRALFVAAMGF